MKKHSNNNNKLNVDICAALLTRSPPRLPLREEIPSLGFEVIYRASGVGIKASQHEAYRAARSYRRQEEVKELKKRRFFPKSSKRIKEKLAERKRKELELKHTKSAISYEVYQRELEHDRSGDTGSSSSGVSSNMSTYTSETTLSSPRQLKEAAEKLRKEQVKRRWGQSVRKNRTFGRNKNNESQSPPPTTVEFYKQKNAKLQDVLGMAAFPDYLAPVVDTATGGYTYSETAASTTPRSSTVKSNDPSTITTPQHSIGRPHHHVEFQFGSPSSVPYLPALNTVEERVDETDNDGVHDALYNDAFKSVGSFPDLLLLDGTDNRGAFSDIQAPPFTPPSTRTATSKDPSSISTPTSMEKQADKMNVQIVVSTAAPGINLPGLEVDKSTPGEPKTFQSGTVQQATGQESFNIPSSTKALMESVKNAFASMNGKQDAYSTFESSTTTSKVSTASGLQAADAITPALQKHPQEHSKANDEKTTEGLMMTPETNIIEKFTSATMREYDGGLWLASARLAMESIATDMLKLVGGIGSDVEMATIEEFFTLLAKPSVTTKQVEPTLAVKPEFAQIPRESDSRMALHILCARGLPHRAFDVVGIKTAVLVEDISDFKDLLLLVQGMNPTACEAQDCSGDLPVHVLATTLMQWEALWYDSVYQQAGQDVSGKADISDEITKLYETMSQCIEILLKPVAGQPPLCNLGGSVGKLLPLHIASIFTTSLPTLRRVLEANPSAATIPCDLGHLRTFVPNRSLPLELHDTLSTDFPKWEIEAKGDSNPEIKWSQSKMVDHGFEDCIRRSDLLFAYNPIEPYSKEKSRIRRLESRIQYEAKHAIEDNRMRPSQASELVWTWICTYRDPMSKSAPYLSSVKRVVEALPLRSVQMLASVATKSGQLVIDAAAPECSSVIRRRMERVSEAVVPIPSASTMGSSEKSKMTSPTLKSWEAIQLARLSTTEKGLAKHVCSLIFGLQDISYPTSFVILPYKLKLSKDGKTGIESADSASAAIQFADHLLQLTDPRSILYFLDKKSKKIHGVSLYGEDQNESRLSHYPKVKEQQELLMKLYGDGPAYLYLIDESTGIPCLRETKQVYPIVLEDSGNIIRKILPLMLVGMLQMRGEKALSVLISVLLDDGVTIVPQKWIDAAKEIGAYLHSQKTKEAEPSSLTDATTDELLTFMSNGMSRLRHTETDSGAVTASEWEIELSILKTLLDINDPNQSFSGLHQKQEANDLFLWTTTTTSASQTTTQTNRSNTPFIPIGYSRSNSVDLQAMEKDAHIAETTSESATLDQVDALSRSRSEAGAITSKSHPIDVDIIDDIIEQDREIQRKQSGPVDLDESIASSKSSGPAIEELSRKHDELSQLYYESVRSVRTGSTPPLGFPQPPDDDRDEGHKDPQPRRPHETKPLRIVKSVYSDENDSDTDDDYILHSRTLPGLESLSTLVSTNDDLQHKKTKKATSLSLLFDDLAISEHVPEDEGREPVSSNRQATLDEGERVWNDMKSHLDHSEILCEHVPVLHLKVGLSKEAEKLSRLSRRVRAMDVASKKRRWPAGMDACETELEWQLDGFNYAARTRMLLFRLSALEDSVLVSQIRLQHTALETFVVSENLRSLIGVHFHSPEGLTKTDVTKHVETVNDVEHDLRSRKKQQNSEANAALLVDEGTGEVGKDRPPASIEFERFEFMIPEEEDSTTDEGNREWDNSGLFEI